VVAFPAFRRSGFAVGDIHLRVLREGGGVSPVVASDASRARPSGVTVGMFRVRAVGAHISCCSTRNFSRLLNRGQGKRATDGI